VWVLDDGLRLEVERADRRVVVLSMMLVMEELPRREGVEAT